MRNLTLLALLICGLTLFAQPSEDILARTAVLKLPGMEKVAVRKNAATYDGTHRLDLYLPAGSKEAKFPVIVFINGVGIPALKEWGQYTSWPRLVAARGMAAVTYETSGEKSQEQTEALLAYLHAHAAELRLDASRIAIWACSANGRVGTRLAATLAPGALSGAAFYYAIMTTPPARDTLPLFIARAGIDGLTLNRSIEDYVTAATKLEAPVTFVNYPEGVHGFELDQDTPESKRIIQATLDFFESALRDPKRTAPREMTPAALESMLSQKGIDATIAHLRGLPANAFVRQEGTLNTLGYSMFDSNLPGAIKLLELAVELNPTSPNAYDSLGDAYEKAGRTAEAIAASEKALQLLQTSGISGFRRDAIRRSAEEKLKRLRK